MFERALGATWTGVDELFAVRLRVAPRYAGDARGRQPGALASMRQGPGVAWSNTARGAVIVDGGWPGGRRRSNEARSPAAASPKPIVPRALLRCRGGGRNRTSGAPTPRPRQAMAAMAIENVPLAVLAGGRL